MSSENRAHPFAFARPLLRANGISRSPRAALWSVLLLGMTTSVACANASDGAAGTSGGAASQPASTSTTADTKSNTGAKTSEYADLPTVPEGHEVAILAGGCFWCMESDFEPIAGVKAVVSGYIGGNVDRPTYRQVSSRTTGHAEAVWVLYDPSVITYAQLLDEFWVRIDPTTDDRQFCDVGDEYRPEIFYLDDEQKAIAEKSKEEVKKTKPFPAPIVVDITNADRFWTAENYHQDFYKTTPGRYYSYREGCGRDARLKALWGAKAKTKAH